MNKDSAALLETNVTRLISMGYDDSQVINAMGIGMPQIIQNEVLRRSLSAENVPFDLKSFNSLSMLVRKMRSQLEEDERARRMEDEFNSDQNGAPISQIKEIRTERIVTRWDSINQLFGTSKYYDDTTREVTSVVSGIPIGKLNLLGGEEGVGKTRWYTSLILHLAEDFNMKCGVFQGEMNPSEYKELMLNMCRGMGFYPKRALDNIHVFTSKDHQSHCESIERLGIKYFIWDSFPLLDKCNRKDDITAIVLDIKRAIRTSCAGLMIVHLNERGQMKGNNHIRYMADGSFYMMCEEALGENMFSITSGKNRSGGRNIKCFGGHRNDAIAVLDTESSLAVLAQHKKDNKNRRSSPTGK